MQPLLAKAHIGNVALQSRHAIEAGSETQQCQADPAKCKKATRSGCGWSQFRYRPCGRHDV